MIAVHAGAAATSRAARTSAPGSSSGDSFLREGFRTLASDGGNVDAGLAATLAEILERPGSLFRARLAYGILREHNVEWRTARPVAIAIEYFHTASLLLDDLPAMDNAETRRGAPCCHRTHGDAGAILAALALINRAYALLWQVFATLPPTRARGAAKLVERCLGASGILSGQARDLRFGTRATTDEPTDEGRAAQAARIQAIADGKTGSLLRLTVVLPAIIAGLGREQRRALDRAAGLWGRVYQALDDFGDRLDQDQDSGKTGRRDAKLGRPNLVAALGTRSALETVDQLLTAASASLEPLADEPAPWRAVFRTQGRLAARYAAVAERLAARPAPTTPKRRRTASPLAFLADHLDHGSSPGRTAVVTIPAPAIDATHLLDIMSGSEAVFWEQDQCAMAGIGSAHRLQARGAARFATLQADARRLERRLRTAVYPGLPACPTRFLGGFAFQPGSAQHPPWRDFDDASFVLPEILYRHDRHGADGHGADGHGACLTIALPGEDRDCPRARDACLERAGRLLEALTSRAVRPPADTQRPSPFAHVSWPEHAAWHGKVLDIQQAIAAGQVEKVVASETTQVLLVNPPHLPSLLRRLRHDQPGTFRFAFGRGTRTFVGATPECLVTLEALRLRTMALAGTAPLNATDDALLTSAKDRFEHRLVVNALNERLLPWCSDLVVPATPRIRRIGAVRHLETPITGTLAEPRHILDLVARLHPTPAVGGTPTAAALAWIEAHEVRGWYAAPVGWFDLEGNGEMAVALRSALIEDRGVMLFAGAGIVAASDPEAEYAEAQLKASALLGSLRAARPVSILHP